jgi:hypothetical protein
MFSITGQLLKAFPERQTNRETGESVDRYRIQLLGEIPLRDGSGVRFDMVTLNVESMGPYVPLVGKTVRVPFGFFAPGKGQVISFVPKGAKPEVVQA